MTRHIALVALIGFLVAPPATAGGMSETRDMMAGETALSSERLERVRGLGNEEEPAIDDAAVRATGEAGTNTIDDSFKNFRGVGHVIQNNGNGATIGVTTRINVGPQVTVGPQG